MDLNDQIARCRLMVSLVAVDEKITDEEAMFLRRTFERMGVTEQEMGLVMEKHSESAAVAVIKGLDRVDRLEVLDDLSYAAFADGHLDEHEKNYIERMAQELDLDEQDVAEALGRAKALH